MTIEYNFDILIKQLSKIDLPDNSEWNISSIFEILKYFIESYNYYMEVNHPPIKTEYLQEYADNLQFVIDENGKYIELFPEYYFNMIDSYFETEYKGCNYRLGHFMSGKVRLLKYYETQL